MTYAERPASLDDLRLIEGTAMLHLAFLYPQVRVYAELKAAPSRSYRLSKKLEGMGNALERNITKYEEQLRSVQEAIARLEQENTHDDHQPADVREG